DFFARLGLAPERQEVLPGRENVFARVDVPGATRTLLLESHMDTVTLEPVGRAMIEPVEREGRLWGRGSCDTKASLAAMLTALETTLAGRSHPLLGRPTFTVATIHGGMGVNIVPEHCEITVDRRTLPSERAADVIAEVEAALSDLRARAPAVKVEIGEPFANIG